MMDKEDREQSAEPERILKDGGAEADGGLEAPEALGAIDTNVQKKMCKPKSAVAKEQPFKVSDFGLDTLAEELNISDFGVVRARVFDDLCLDLRAGQRSNPFLIMPTAKSIIVCIFSYNNPHKGSISKYAMGRDYHKVVRDKLSEFAKPLVNSGYQCLTFCDSWDLNERYLAVQAGLGFIGWNRMLIHPIYGSFIFIGAILTDCLLEASTPLGGGCLQCGACVHACPGNALSLGGQFSQMQCLSSITQKKGELSREEVEILKRGGMIWGCDRCQEVCPHNQTAPLTRIQAFTEDLMIDFLPPDTLSARQFKRDYGDRAFAWRGLAPLRRNRRILDS